MTRKAQGFTLLEMLVSMALFSMVMAMVYTALEPAGKGFQMLNQERIKLEQSYYLVRQLRSDLNYIANSNNMRTEAITLAHHLRSGNGFDELQLTVKVLGRSGISLVRYAIDEERMVLTRQVKNPLARPDSNQEDAWNLANVTSFEIQLMDQFGYWQDVWNHSLQPGRLPSALRMRVDGEQGKREWIVPLPELSS